MLRMRRYGLSLLSGLVTLTCAIYQQIKRDWRDYQSRFEAADRLSQAKASAEVVAQRRATMEQWEAYRSKVTKRLASFKSRMESLRCKLWLGFGDWVLLFGCFVPFFYLTEILQQSTMARRCTWKRSWR
jgi:fructosamine-3-kinase